MRRACPSHLVWILALAACQGDPVGEAPSDSGDVDSAISDIAIDTRPRDTSGDSPPSETGDDTGHPPPATAGKPCDKTADCDPATNPGVACLTEAPTPMCYGAKCTKITSGTTLGECDVDGVCIDDGLGGGLCTPLCLFNPTTGRLDPACIGNNACWYVGRALIGGVVFGYGRCEGRCGDDDDCPAGSKCQNDGACVPTPIVYPGALGDPCAATEDGTKCACVYSLTTKLGYCSKFCHVGDTICPTGYSCDANVPLSLGTVPTSGMLGNCLKDCDDDSNCTALNGYCEELAGVGRRTCQPGSRP